MAGNQQAGTGSPVSGTQTDLAGYERRGELKTVQQAERASGQEIHQTLSLLLAIPLRRLWTGRGHKHLLHYHHLSACRHLTNRR